MLSNPIDFSSVWCLLFLKKVTRIDNIFVYGNIFQLETKSKKVCMRKHKRYLRTNNILRWKTVLSGLCFLETVLFCSIFCYSNMTLTKLNGISFVFCISKTRLSGEYLCESSVFLFKKDKLKFLKSYYGIESEEELLKNVLSKMICFSDSLPYNWKRPPWKTRKKGSMQRLDLYYSEKVVVFNLIRDLVVSNKGLLGLLLRLIKDYIPSLYSCEIVVVERLELEKRRVFVHSFCWSSYYREELVVLIFSSLPLSYWSIYSHLIEDIELRKSLLKSSICSLVSESNGSFISRKGVGDYYED